MRSSLFTVVVSVAAALSLACGPDCKDPDVSVSLAVSKEEVRALPVLASGAVALLDQDVPDSHGDVSVTLNITGADSVIIDELEFTETINGTAKDLTITRRRVNDADFTDADSAANGDTLRFNWRTKQLADLALTEGQPHSAHVKVTWRHTGCRNQTGVAELDVPGTIKSPNTVKNFVLQMAEAGRLQTVGGAQAKLSLKSNAPSGQFLQSIANPKLNVTFFSEGLPPIIGLGQVDSAHIALQVAGVPKSLLQSGETLDVYTSSNAKVGNAPYDHAGTAASTQALVGGGKAVVTLSIDSERSTSTTGPVTDVIVTLVDVP